MQLDFSPLVQAIVAELREALAPDEVLDTKGAAALLLVSETSVLRLVTSGEIPGRKLGGLWRFRRSALLNHVTYSAQEPPLTETEYRAPISPVQSRLPTFPVEDHKVAALPSTRRQRFMAIYAAGVAELRAAGKLPPEPSKTGE